MKQKNNYYYSRDWTILRFICHAQIIDHAIHKM